MKARLLLLFVAFAAVVGLSARFLPWWGTTLVVLGVLVGCAVLLPMLIKRGFSSMMTGMFESKSCVLREAAIEVHGVELTDREAVKAARRAECEDPDDDDDEDWDETFEDAGPLKFVVVEATITPKPGGGPFGHWEPSELRLVPLDHDTSMEAMMADDDPDEECAGNVALAQFVEEDGSLQGDYGKVSGAHRVRLTFACPESMTGQAKLQYYFEGLGELKIPA